MKLTPLNPAQAFLLLKLEKATDQELLKYTFLHLIYNNILKIHHEWRIPHPRDPTPRLHTLLSKGSNFHLFPQLAYQHPFTHPFIREDKSYPLFPFLQEIGTKYWHNDYKLTQVYPYLVRHHYFNSSLGLKNYGLFFLTKKGKDVQKRIDYQLGEAEIELPHLIKSSPQKTVLLLQELGANVLLLQCFHQELIMQFRSVDFTAFQKLLIDGIGGLHLENFLTVFTYFQLPFERVFVSHKAIPHEEYFDFFDLLNFGK